VKIANIVFLFLPFMSGCHSNNNDMSGNSQPEKPPVQQKAPLGDPYSNDLYPVPMITTRDFIQKALSKFKLALLDGYCNVDPRNLKERGSRLSFDGKKVTFEVKRGNCIEVVEREGKWVPNGDLASLYVTGGFLKSSCPDSGESVSDRIVYAFEIDESLKYVALVSTTSEACWWAKKIE